ncbi:MAG: hypothetical protein Kow0047_28380 [Anaerolineae bacterium]
MECPGAPALQVVARTLPLTYAVEALRATLTGQRVASAGVDLAVIAAFAGAFFALAVRTLARSTT